MINLSDSLTSAMHNTVRDAITGNINQQHVYINSSHYNQPVSSVATATRTINMLPKTSVGIQPPPPSMHQRMGILIEAMAVQTQQLQQSRNHQPSAMEYQPTGQPLSATDYHLSASALQPMALWPQQLGGCQLIASNQQPMVCQAPQLGNYQLQMDPQPMTYLKQQTCGYQSQASAQQPMACHQSQPIARQSEPTIQQPQLMTYQSQPSGFHQPSAMTSLLTPQQPVDHLWQSNMNQPSV